MEYVTGGDLWRCIRRPPQLNTADIRWLMFQILIGLQHLHTLNIMHRDLKPQNILLSAGPNPIAKITDFSHSTASEFPTALVGTAW